MTSALFLAFAVGCLVGFGIVYGLFVWGRERRSHRLYIICALTTLIGFAAAFDAIVLHAKNPEDTTHMVAFELWTSLVALALSGILATFGVKHQQKEEQGKSVPL